jgi:DNA-directed RNA polymerase specialized sigma24 family protein
MRLHWYRPFPRRSLYRDMIKEHWPACYRCYGSHGQGAQPVKPGDNALDRMREVRCARSMPDPETSAVRKDGLGRVLQELKTVPRQFSSMFIERHLEGLSEREVAEAEGLERGPASSYLSRANQRHRQGRARLVAFL